MLMVGSTVAGTSCWGGVSGGSSADGEVVCEKGHSCSGSGHNLNETSLAGCTPGHDRCFAWTRVTQSKGCTRSATSLGCASAKACQVMQARFGKAYECCMGAGCNQRSCQAAGAAGDLDVEDAAYLVFSLTSAALIVSAVFWVARRLGCMGESGEDKGRKQQFERLGSFNTHNDL
jgi:hypothetical protein